MSKFCQIWKAMYFPFLYLLKNCYCIWIFVLFFSFPKFKIALIICEEKYQKVSQFSNLKATRNDGEALIKALQVVCFVNDLKALSLWIGSPIKDKVKVILPYYLLVWHPLNLFKKLEPNEFYFWNSILASSKDLTCIFIKTTTFT